jgi:hypothetical protein
MFVTDAWDGRVLISILWLGIPNFCLNPPLQIWAGFDLNLIAGYFKLLAKPAPTHLDRSFV